MEEMTFEEFSREVNNIYKKNCEVYYKLASHFGMTETMFDILFGKMMAAILRRSFVKACISESRQ